MEALALLLKKAVLSAAVRKLLDFVPTLKPDDPQAIKKKYCLDLVKKFEDKYQPPPATESPEKTKFCTIQFDVLRDHARWYKFRAQMAWGRPSPRDRFKSAWLYATAGRLSEMARDKAAATDLYHFAANGLREVEAYRASIEYYVKAAKNAEGEWVARCLQRAYGVAQVAGDDVEAENLQKMLRDWIENQARPQ